MQEPETPEEWQAALDTVVTILAVDTAAKYGLARVDVTRCGEILRRAKALGYRPSRRTLDWVTTAPSNSLGGGRTRNPTNGKP